MSTDTNLLNQLIIGKYGIEKFDTGCQLVAQWLNFSEGTSFTGLFIKEVCTNDKLVHHFTRKQVRCLKKLLFKKDGP